ncbi:TPA: SEC-C domain-containing protein [Enterobacter asburiae]|nr:SEC-C domain-containing protein [Enterobacter asburiae]HDR2772222.1 SEC-C domain-containing protein [Enterobacter asburiae]
MLRKIIRGSGFTQSEEKLIEFADDAFFGLWSYPNIYSDEGYSKNNIGKEVSDLLVIFDKDIIIFSDKAIAFNKDKDPKIAWQRWFKKSVIKSCTQLFGAEKFIKDHPERLFVDKECSINLPIKIDKSFSFHLVAVTNNISEPAMSYFDKIGKGSSATLVNIYPFNAQQCLENPFCVGDIYPEKTFVHILDEAALKLLLTELNTANDFISYLNEKEKVVRQKKLLVSAGEEETLAAFIMGDKTIIPDDIIKNDQTMTIPEGEWENYKTSFNYQYQLSMKKGSVFWDNLIHNFSISILSANVGFFGEIEFSMHELGVRELAKESRQSRYYLSKNFQEKLKTTQSHLRTSRMVESIDESGKFYLFLFFPNDNNLSYNDYRIQRISYIKAYTTVAFNKYRKIKKLITIATEPQNTAGRSEDLIYSISPENFTKEQNEEAKRLSRKYKILSDFLPTKITKSNDFQTATSKNEKIGRNASCPCGSGIKFKKCHGANS